MPIALTAGRPAICVRRAAFEGAGLVRAQFDEQFNLTPDEFVVEAALLLIGPLPNDDMLSDLIQLLEARGLVYFDDFFELSGNWPPWLRLYAMVSDR